MWFGEDANHGQKVSSAGGDCFSFITQFLILEKLRNDAPILWLFLVLTIFDKGCFCIS